ncbi:MAG: Rrf2 family transcriptional regulator [Hungatella sp.]|nr:Rrf2 family transcriptional regulator [Hungatella sp.]
MISTKGRYALRVMIDLARQKKEGYIPLSEIAARQEISEKYLEIILKILVKENLLKGLRGKGGGYKLTRSPEQYNVGEILELTEGTLSTVACLSGSTQPCSRAFQCPTLPMWQELDTMVRDYFYHKSLADLI